jgi:hypothetical protein
MDGKLQQHWSVINKSMGRAASHILSRQFHKYPLWLEIRLIEHLAHLTEESPVQTPSRRKIGKMQKRGTTI